MELSVQEFEGMQSKAHLWFNEHMELAGFKRWGLKIPDAEILEVGCGWGYCASLIMREKPKRYVGLDVMEEQLAIARKRGMENAVFEKGDAADLSRFEDNSFDYVLDFCILCSLYFHFGMFGTTVDGKFELLPFTTIKLIDMLVLVISLLIHIGINIRSLLVSMGIFAPKRRRWDIVLVLSVILVFIAVSLILYYLSWCR